MSKSFRFLCRNHLTFNINYGIMRANVSEIIGFWDIKNHHKGPQMHDIYTTLELATIDVLKKYKREHLLAGTRSLAALYYKVAHKYLTYYNKDEAEETLLDAWSHIFLTNGDKNIRMFIGKHPKTGEKIHITSYLSMLMRNAIINCSKKNNGRFTNEEGVNPIEQETFEDAYMRTISTPSKMKTYRVDDDYLNYLQESLADARAVLQQLIDKNSPSKRIKKIEKGIEKLQRDILEAKGEVKHTPVEDWESVYEDDQDTDDTVEFDNLINRVRAKLTIYEEAVLAGMLGGMSNRELQAVLEDIDVADTIKAIQDKVLDIAEADEFERDDSSMVETIQQLSFKKTRKPEQINLSEINRSFRKCVSEFCSKETQDFIHREVYLGVQDLNQVVAV